MYLLTKVCVRTPFNPSEPRLRLLRLLDDDVRRLLANEVCRDGGEGAGNVGENGGVDDTQAAHAAHTEARVEHGVGVAVGADGDGARAVVAPGGVLGIVEDLILTVE